MFKLTIHSSGRCLANPDGTPFVWLGDTLWCWYGFTEAELDEYLARRAAQGFTVVQMRLFRSAAEHPPGATDGEPPFHAPADTALPWDPGTRGTQPFDFALCRPNETYWRRVDAWLERLAAAGLVAAPVLFWGDTRSLRRIDADQMYALARWVGNRYRDFDRLVWLTLGEATHPGAPGAKVLAAVRGLRDGDTGGKLLSIHACTRMHTAADYWAELDFHNWQTSHWCAPSYLPDRLCRWQTEEGNGNWTVWEAIAADYARQPPKPVLDTEAWYEAAPIQPPPRYPSCRSNFGEFSQGVGAQAYHVRRRAYFTVLAGACGHTYGANLVWAHGTVFQKEHAERDLTWRTALDFPGARHMSHMAALLRARPFDRLVPDQALVSIGQSDEYDSHVQAARAADGSYAYVYIADGHPVGLDLTRLAAGPLRAQWFDPRTGAFAPAPCPDPGPAARFDPPGRPGLDNDWMLVLETE